MNSDSSSIDRRGVTDNPSMEVPGLSDTISPTELERIEFCPKCQKTIDYLANMRSGSDGDEHMDFYHNTCFLREQAERGCKLCALYLATIEIKYVGVLKDKDIKLGGMIRRRQRHHDAMLTISVFSGSSSNAEIEEMFQLSVFLWLPPKPILQDFPNLDLIEHKNVYRKDVDVLSVVAQWLKICSDNHGLNRHKYCIRDSTFLPSRLVRVKSDASSQVVDTTGLGKVKYATLSHCWGTTKYLTLKSDNLEDFQSEIPEEALSRTFQDALTVARYLSIEYIWIDSLCIIQDLESDWLAESATMGNIYSHSVLNISAASATDGSQGFLNKRDANRHHAFKTNILRKRGWEDCYCMYDGDLISESPLASRAWVLQERMLARRNVHFTTGQVFWECYKATACESVPGGLSEFLRQRTKINSTFSSSKRPIGDCEWQDVVQTYSKCKLTFGADKLIALSGIARRMQKLMQAEYVAGMWHAEDTDRHSILYQLAWYSASALRPPPNARIPSWSWISVDSKVSMSHRYRWNVASYTKVRPYVDILEKSVTCYGNDPFGTVKSATLTLACELFCVFRPQGANWMKSLNANHAFSSIQDMIVQHYDNDQRFVLLALWHSQTFETNNLIWKSEYKNNNAC